MKICKHMLLFAGFDLIHHQGVAEVHLETLTIDGGGICISHVIRNDPVFLFLGN